MLLVMRNLPIDVTYGEIKSLIQTKCFVAEVILDKLFRDTPTTKKVTVGVAKDDDATRIIHRLNGTYIRGLQILVEDINGAKAGKDSNRPAGYQGQNDQNQMEGYQQSGQNPWMAQQMGMYQYGYGMKPNQMGYQMQQATNQQGTTLQMNYGYEAWMSSNNPGIAPLMQNSFMGYGNQQGQQGQQSSTPQGQYGGSGPGYQAAGPRKELGFGHSTGNNQSDKEKRPNNERGYGSQASYSGNQKDRGPQGSWRDTQQDTGRGSQGAWRGSDDRGRGSQHQRNESDSRSYGSGNFDKDTRFGSGNAQKGSVEYGSQSTNQRERSFESKYSWENSNRGGSGFDRSFEGDDIHDRDGRKRRHSPERVEGYKGNSGERFQGGRPKFEGHPGRDSYNRVGPPSRNVEKPSNPYSWSNTSSHAKPGNRGVDQSRSFSGNPRPFGGEQSRTVDEKPTPFGRNQSRSFDDKPRPFSGPDSKERFNDSKHKIVWNRTLQPQSSPARGTPAKRPKMEENPAVSAVVPPSGLITVKDPKFDQKTANRSISWRGEGVSALAREIFQYQGENSPIKKKGQAAMKLLKKTLNTRIEELIKQKYPNNPYPLLHGPDIVKLYRDTYPARTDDKLCMSCVEEAPVTASAAQNAQPKSTSGPPVANMKPMGQPSVPKPMQVKPVMKEVKPFLKPKPKLTDLLPPQALQQQPRRPKLMLGPNALKKKPKPYNVEKRARTEQKNQSKREFLDENLYKCPTPLMEEALNAVLDELTDVFYSAVDEQPTKNKEEKLIGDTIRQKVAPEFRAMVRLHTIKRILNITNTLMLRIFVAPGKAPKENVEQALKPYGVVNLKSSSMSKTAMYMAGVKTYHNYDRLSKTLGIPVMGRNGPCMITAKPLHLTMPFKIRRLLRQKQYSEMTGDYEEKDDFAKGIKEKDDFDDDDDDYELDDDDDVVDVTKESDVIELSGDETTLKVPDEEKDDKTETTNEGDAEIAGDNVDEVKEVVENKDSTIDLTMGEDNVDLSNDERMSEAIADEMGDSVLEIDEDEIGEDDLEDY